MAKRFAVVGAAVALSVGAAAIRADAADVNNRFAVRGIGTTICSDYSELRARDDEASEPFIHWLTGFVTAYNWLQPDTYDISAEYKSHGFAIWLDRYCEAHPTSRIIDAANALVNAVYGKRKKTESES